MKRGILLAAAVVAMGMFTVVASAQPQGRGGNRGGRPGGMQRGGGMTRGIGVAQLLRSPDVQKEIKLTDAEKTQLQAAMAAGRPQFDRQAMQDLSQEERRAKMQEFMKKMRAQQAKIQEKLGQILKPEQLKRLEQIRLQVMGPMALASPDVASKLGLTDDQKTKMREAMRGVFAKLRQGRGGNAGPPSAEARKKMEETIKTAIMGVLTDDQKEKYEELIGKPFDTSKLRARGMMMGGGRGQARPGAGRGQGRPGQGRPGRGRPGQGGGGNG